MIITRILLETELNRPIFRLLCSDMHLGAANVDEDAIVRQFDEAVEIGADILINGDVFDCVCAKDKRFDLATLNPKIAGKKDTIGAVVDYAFDLFAPYRDNIKLIGIGNHEEAFINWHSVDPVRMLIDKLNNAGGNVIHAGFRGYVTTEFKILDVHRRHPIHKLFYLHGVGGDSPITKGTIDFYRQARHWTCDALTFGHKHNSLVQREVVGDVSPSGHYVEKEQVLIQTGSYFKNYSELDDGTVLNQSYAAKAAHPPKPIGGAFLCLTPYRDKNDEISIKQDVLSSVIKPWDKKIARKSVAA